MLLSCVNAQAYMKHNSRKHVVPEWKICKDRKFSHLPLSPSIETSRKHLGLLFSDIFHAKRKRKQALTTHEGTVYTRGHTRTSFTTWHTGGYRWSDHWFLDKMAATGWYNRYIIKNCFFRGRSHALSRRHNVQQNEDGDFYRRICSFYAWSVVSHCGVSKTASRSVQ